MGQANDRHDDYFRARCLSSSEEGLFGRSAACVPLVPTHWNQQFQWYGTSEHYDVVLEDWLLENLSQRYVIPEDFNAYKQLTRPTAKGIFGNLHLWFHASQGRPVEKAYSDLCNLLNVQAYPHLSKINSTMGLALNEFVAIKYLSKWDVQKMSSKTGYKVVLVPGEELISILENTRSDRREQSPTCRRLIPSTSSLPPMNCRLSMC